MVSQGCQNMLAYLGLSARFLDHDCTIGWQHHRARERERASERGGPIDPSRERERTRGVIVCQWSPSVFLVPFSVLLCCFIFCYSLSLFSLFLFTLQPSFVLFASLSLSLFLSFSLHLSHLLLTPPLSRSPSFHPSIPPSPLSLSIPAFSTLLPPPPPPPPLVLPQPVYSILLRTQSQMANSPNCTQPRSRNTHSSDATSSTSSLFLLGPHPPQIQLQFLENEPLPPPSSTLNIAPETTEEIDTEEVLRRDSSDAVMVERKDSGYGGSVSRSSSLAASFGRGIRKVFWKTSAKGSIESVVITDPPVLDYGIPQDVLDHESWAQDLAQRLSLAAGPDAVTAWLGQLSAEGSEEASGIALVEENVRITNGSGSEDINGTLISATMMNVPEGSASSESMLDMIEEVFFTIPASVPAPAPVPAPVSAPVLAPGSVTELHVSKPLPPTKSFTVPGPAAKTLRQVLSIEQLNKPQPPIPANSPVKPAMNQASRSSASTSPFNTIARKFTAADFGFRKGSNGKQAEAVESRSDIAHKLFHTANGAAASTPSLRATTGLARDANNVPLMTSPDEVEGESYLAIKPASKRSNRFFKSLTTSVANEMKNSRQNEVRPLSEVLLSHSNLSPEEISAEIVTASRSSSLRSPPLRRAALPQWDQPSPAVSAVSTFRTSQLSRDSILSPPEPLFYNKGRAASASSLGEASSCGSVESTDDWDSLTQTMINHSQAQNARYNEDLKGLQALLSQPLENGSPSRPQSLLTHSTNTSTGSLTLPSASSSAGSRDTVVAVKPSSKKDDYMSHRISGASPKVLPVSGKSKPKKSRLSMTYGGGELEVVKSAKFDTPEAIARNKEIRKFISQEIYTTEQNYLQYLQTVQEVFVDPLFRSLQTDKPFIPKSNALYHLLSHIADLIAVSSQLAQNLEDCVRDEVWSDDSTLIGTIFLNVKEPLCIFLKYGQAYGKGMKALRTLMKSKRSSISAMPSSSSPFIAPASTFSSCSSAASNHLTVPGVGEASPRLGKRRSLPSLFSLNATSAPSSSSMMAFAAAAAAAASTSSAASSAGRDQARRLSTTSSNSTSSVSKAQSSHGSIRHSVVSSSSTTMTSDLSEFQRFLQNCAGGKEMTGRFSLADLLILPIQRVTRYCLLLKDLKRHTHTDHDDYVGLVHALEQLHTLAMATNNVQPMSMRL